MKKVLSIILIVAIILIAILLGWYWLFPGSSIPATQDFVDALPFGSGEDINIPTESGGLAGETGPLTDQISAPTSNLFHISDSPVAGAVALAQDGATIVRYLDRATGHIYDVNLSTLKKTRITNQTLPKVYEAHFTPDGNSALVRVLDDKDVVENISITLIPPVTSTSTSQSGLYTVSATALRADMSDVAVGPTGTLYSVLKNPSSIVSSDLKGSGAKTLYTSAFYNWRIMPTEGSPIIFTKASAGMSGYAYRLNTSNGLLTKILGPLAGLVTIPNKAGTEVAYSYVSEGVTKLATTNLATNKTATIFQSTLAEKCVWNSQGAIICGVPTDVPGAGEPDNWYRGITHFSDRIWILGTVDYPLEPLAVINPRNVVGVEIDVYQPHLSPEEDYLIFTNKNDLTLWALKIQ